MTFDRCTLHSSIPDELAIFGGSATLANSTTLRGTGVVLRAHGGTVYYQLPAPAGHWLPNADCRVYRKPCGEYNDACQARFDACSLIADPCETQTASGCTDMIAIQPCEWVANSNALVGQKTYAVPSGIDIAGNFPYLCPRGSYCPEGSSVPLLCGPGTNATECIKVDASVCPSFVVKCGPDDSPWVCGQRLADALADPREPVLELQDGNYSHSSTFIVDRDVTVRATNAGQAVLDGEQTRRVMSIDYRASMVDHPASMVHIEGLVITRVRNSKVGDDHAILAFASDAPLLT